MSWLLLRGLTREARHWGDFSRIFTQHNAITSPVIALDLPGNGKFFGQRSPASVQAMTEFARAQLQQQGHNSANGPHYLLAMSLGAMVAADWAQRYPEEIAALVLINTSMRPLSTMSQRLRPRNWLPLARLAMRWPGEDDVGKAVAAERLIYKMTCKRHNTQESDIAEWLHLRRQAPVSAGNALRQLAAATRFSSKGPPSCATLVLSSLADALVNPDCSTQLAQAWKARHNQHPWAGHDLPHDDAEWICERVSDWLASA